MMYCDEIGMPRVLNKENYSSYKHQSCYHAVSKFIINQNAM